MGVKLIGFDTCIAKLKSLNGVVSAENMAKMANIGVAGIKSNFEGNPLGWQPNAQSTIVTKGSSQPNVDQGHLKGAVFAKISDTIIDFVNNDVKAYWMHFGTKPHTIVAKKMVKDKKTGKNRLVKLKFKNASGKFEYRSKVAHPGTVPRPHHLLRPDVIEEMMDVLHGSLKVKLTATEMVQSLVDYES